MNERKIASALSIILCAFMLSACQAMGVRKPMQPGHWVSAPREEPGEAPTADEAEAKRSEKAGLVLDLRNLPNLADIIPELLRKRVVFVGESHANYGHHLSQLEIIRRLHEANPELAIGLEFFQHPYQTYLDGYVTGALDEKEMLVKTEYYDRWVYDFRLYRPILEYAREHNIPLIALNLPREITRKVARVGIEGLSEQERAQIPPERDDSDAVYREYVRGAYEQHAMQNRADFENFFQAQLLWDEGMAERAYRYLVAHPGKRMVVLAGTGHLVNGFGIPKRLTRRLPIESAIVLPMGGIEVKPGVGDFLIYSEQVELPPRGRMGAMLIDGEPGAMLRGVVPGGPAARAGMKNGDLILSLEGQPVNSVADIKIALQDRKPGDKISVVVHRKRFIFRDEELTMEMELGE